MDKETLVEFMKRRRNEEIGNKCIGALELDALMNGWANEYYETSGEVYC